MNLAEIKAAAEELAAFADTCDACAGWNAGPCPHQDIAFIALSRTAVPWLVARVEELAEALRGVTDLAERLAGGGEYVAIGKARAALARLEVAALSREPAEETS